MFSKLKTKFRNLGDGLKKKFASEETSSSESGDGSKEEEDDSSATSSTAFVDAVEKMNSPRFVYDVIQLALKCGERSLQSVENAIAKCADYDHSICKTLATITVHMVRIHATVLSREVIDLCTPSGIHPAALYPFFCEVGNLVPQGPDESQGVKDKKKLLCVAAKWAVSEAIAEPMFFSTSDIYVTMERQIRAIKKLWEFDPPGLS